MQWLKHYPYLLCELWHVKNLRPWNIRFHWLSLSQICKTTMFNLFFQPGGDYKVICSVTKKIPKRKRCRKTVLGFTFFHQDLISKLQTFLLFKTVSSHWDTYDRACTYSGKRQPIRLCVNWETFQRFNGEIKAARNWWQQLYWNRYTVIRNAPIPLSVD